MSIIERTQKLIDANKKALENKDLGSVAREMTEATILRLQDDLKFFQLWGE